MTSRRLPLHLPQAVTPTLVLLAAVPWAYAITERQAILGS